MANGRLTLYIEQQRRTLKVFQEYIDSIIDVEVDEKEIQKICLKVAKHLEQASIKLDEAYLLSSSKKL
jgi:transcriptional regulator